MDFPPIPLIEPPTPPPSPPTRPPPPPPVGVYTSHRSLLFSLFDPPSQSELQVQAEQHQHQQHQKNKRPKLHLDFSNIPSFLPQSDTNSKTGTQVATEAVAASPKKAVRFAEETTEIPSPASSSSSGKKKQVRFADQVSPSSSTESGDGEEDDDEEKVGDVTFLDPMAFEAQHLERRRRRDAEKGRSSQSEGEDGGCKEQRCADTVLWGEASTGCSA